MKYAYEILYKMCVNEKYVTTAKKSNQNMNKPVERKCIHSTPMSRANGPFNTVLETTL